MAKTAWIYHLRKHELIDCLDKCQQDTKGNFDDLRKRLVRFVLEDHKEYQQRSNIPLVA